MEVAAQTAVAATPLGALWLARGGSAAVCPDLAATRRALDALPIAALQVEPALARRIEGFGLRRFGELLALPRAGLGARLGRTFLRDIARALGELPDPQACYCFPEAFEQGLELPAPVEAAPVLMFAAHRLVAALSGWLAARNGALRQLVLHIEHGHGAPTSVPLAFSLPVHAAPRIERVLRERLESLRLDAPALGLRLQAGEVVPRPAGSRTLFEGAGTGQEAWVELWDRLVARLGAAAVRGLACHADHRPERASRGAAGSDAQGMPPSDLPPRPLWLVEPPEALREVENRPWRHGALTLLAGPERIEAGWWDDADACRDYFVAIDREGRWLWVFRDARASGGWFLHGVFA